MNFKEKTRRRERTTPMRLKALIGEWEGESMVFLGGVDIDTYDAMTDEEWTRRLNLWKASPDWTGITDTREVEIEIALTTDLFAPPELEGAVVVNPEPQS